MFYALLCGTSLCDMHVHVLCCVCMCACVQVHYYYCVVRVYDVCVVSVVGCVVRALCAWFVCVGVRVCIYHINLITL